MQKGLLMWGFEEGVDESVFVYFVVIVFINK